VIIAHPATRHARRTSYEVCSYVIVGVMFGGVAMLLAFSPDSTVDRNKLAAKEAEEAGISADASINLGGQRKHKRPWTLGRVIKATLLAVGKYCYSYFTPFFMGDFMWAWLSTGFFWTGSYTLSNFMQFYYAVRAPSPRPPSSSAVLIACVLPALCLFIQDAFTQPYHIFNAITISNAESGTRVCFWFSNSLGARVVHTNRKVNSHGQRCPCTRASTWWGRCSSACFRAS